ncbi:hypothetical protein PXJ20_32140 [Paraburkholderia sp. A1RI_3L]|uniref:hypothetical protein n=1 Tax=Paraburkholderia TaxID=1822464 RepID=UPI003B7744BE
MQPAAMPTDPDTAHADTSLPHSAQHQPPPCFATGPVCLRTMHASLPRGHCRLLDRLGQGGLGDHAFLVALLVVPLLDFCELRRLPETNLRAASGLDPHQWNSAINELVRLGALRRIWPRSPNRRIPAFRLARHFQLPPAGCSAAATLPAGQGASDTAHDDSTP